VLLRVASVAAVVIAVLIPASAGAASRAADQQIADDSVLTTDDVPTGFDETPATDEPDLKPGPACKAQRVAAKASDAVPHTEVEFRTPGDATGGGALVDNQVSVFGTAKKAKAAYAAYAASSARKCLTSTYERVFLDQIDDSSARVHVTAERFKPDLGDASVGYDVVIQASARGDSATFYVDVQVVRVGRGLDAFGYFNTGSAPPSDDVDDMTQTGVAKLEDALAT
jgi:hypothetical protein